MVVVVVVVVALPFLSMPRGGVLLSCRGEGPFFFRGADAGSSLAVSPHP